MASIFSKIIEGSIPSIQIDETENEIAFLDIMPCA
ncbi:MAG TPA: HIT family protein, partial [Deltaproteobacteria bacterium]|nr:HIT family protein [Deltaproteobacteria bacterium]